MKGNVVVADNPYKDLIKVLDHLGKADLELAVARASALESEGERTNLNGFLSLLIGNLQDSIANVAGLLETWYGIETDR